MRKSELLTGWGVSGSCETLCEMELCEHSLARKPFECSYNFHEAQTFAIACFCNMQKDVFYEAFSAIYQYKTPRMLLYNRGTKSFSLISV